MPTIINPYGNQQTMGQDLFGLGGVADAFFGPKAATSAYTREKFREQQRQNAATLALPDAIIKGNQDEIVRQGIYAGLVPTTTYGYQQGRGVSQPGIDLATPQGQADVSKLMMAVPGTSFSSTPVGVGANLQKSYDIADMQSRRTAATQQSIADRTVIPTVGPDGRTVYSRTVDAPGQGAPVTYDQARGGLLVNNWANLGGLTQPQQSVIGADKRDNAQNWVQLDAQDRVVARGRTYGNNIDADTNQPLPAGALLVSPLTPAGVGGFTSPTRPGTTEQKDYREAIRHADQTIELGNQILTTVNRNPTIVGPVGNLRRMGQEGLDLLKSLNLQFGTGREGDYEQSVVSARQSLEQKFGAAGARTLIPTLFDRDLNAIETMNGMLVYKAAAAMGQSGRDASDKDIAKVTSYVGQPNSWFMGPNTYKDKVGQLISIIQKQRDDDFGRLEGRSVLPPGRTGAPATTAAPGGTTTTGVPWTVGP